MIISGKGVQYFELHRDWPESYASVRITRAQGSRVSSLMVYRGPCREGEIATFHILPYSTGTISDTLPNNFGWLMVSPRARELFEGVDADIKACTTPIRNIVSPECPPEYLDYWLISTNLVLDCLDTDDPTLTWSDSSRKYVEKYDKLRLLRGRVPPSVSFFCVPQTLIYVVSGPLRDALVNSGISGISFRKCEVV
jgi:hypothetical protein